MATDGALAELGADVRRLRPNVVIGGAAPGAERTWPGRALAVGDAVIGMRISLDCWVIRAGRIRVGDPVLLTESNAEPVQFGGWTLGAPYLAV